MQQIHDFLELPERYYGNEAKYEALVMEPDPLDDAKLTLGRLTIEPMMYQKNLEDLAETLQIVQDPMSDKKFEVGILNTDAPEYLYDAEISSKASISSNMINAVQAAQSAALYPEKRRIHIAGPGKGFLSVLDFKERQHFEKSGSLTYGGEAMPTIKALQRALIANDFNIDRISAHSGGGNIATALMLEIPDDQVSHLYLKGRPNIVNHYPLAFGVRLFLLDRAVNDIFNKSRSRDSWGDIDTLKDHAQEILEDRVEFLKAYNQINEGAPGEQYVSDFREEIENIFTEAMAYSRGSSNDDRFQNGYRIRAAEDTRLALSRHPDAFATFHFPLDDKLYPYRAHLQQFINLSSPPIPHVSRVQGLVMPGTHNDHIFTPSVRWTAEHYAFTRKSHLY